MVIRQNMIENDCKPVVFPQFWANVWGVCYHGTYCRDLFYFFFLIQGYLTVIFLQNSSLHSIWCINLQKSSNTTKEEIGL